MKILPGMCKGKVKSSWNKTGVCPFPAVEDGYCAKHSPKQKLFRLTIRLDKLKKQCSDTEQEIRTTRAFIESMK